MRNVTLEFLLIITDIQSEIFPLQERRIDVRRSSRVNNFSSHFIYSQVISISSLTGRRLKSMISPKILMFGIWGGEKDHDRNEHFCWIDFQWHQRLKSLHPSSTSVRSCRMNNSEAWWKLWGGSLKSLASAITLSTTILYHPSNKYVCLIENRWCVDNWWQSKGEPGIISKRDIPKWI